MKTNPKLLFASIALGLSSQATAVEENENFLRKLDDGNNYSVKRQLPESICGVDDLQHVERYNNRYANWGYTQNYVDTQQRSVGALKNRASNTAGSYCTGTLISNDLFLTASHCVDSNVVNDVVAFNYQLPSNSNTVRTQQFFDVTEIVEDGADLNGRLDFAILRLDGNPGNTFGWKSVQTSVPGDVMIIQHPRGEAKQTDAGTDVVVSGNRVLYGDLDTEPGSSGSGVLNRAGEIIGVHTNGGCRATSGRNSGYTIAGITAVSSVLPVNNYIRAIDSFGKNVGGWEVSKHPRVLADINGDGKEDIIGFGTSSVFTAIANSDGTFQSIKRALNSFTLKNGGWDVAKHPRTVADINGDGLADIIGFGTNSVFTALSNGDGTFASPKVAISAFTYNKGGWRVEKHPRTVADINGDGLADIIGFGTNSVFTALSKGDGTFASIKTAYNGFTINSGGWDVAKHPRKVADINGDGLADIVGFGTKGVYTSLSKGDGTFAQSRFVLSSYAISAGGWDVAKHPRTLADVNGDGLNDIVGFGTSHVYVSYANGDGTFRNPTTHSDEFVYSNGWRVESHPRHSADVNGDGKADLITFSDSGVLVYLTR
ncbi:FG-GAP-like repeat-containing protein [Pseudoalteromonas sp. MTN2-4]|uniref:FG-GAP-like repeat-containing protein n=1 Tax=Pseudoalteromonas sp. MTN2-4 TaxID=3056555 RepID=UPI0036F3CD5E